MALGAIRALKQANKKGIAVVGFDGSPDALKSIKAGILLQQLHKMHII
jgi:ribose transport system substrate-binding protein